MDTVIINVVEQVQEVDISIIETEPVDIAVSDTPIQVTVNVIEASDDTTITIIEEILQVDINIEEGPPDKITDHYSDLLSPTYYYYGYNRNGLWEILRTTKVDINIEYLATISGNPTILNLTQAINNRVSLNYT